MMCNGVRTANRKEFVKEATRYGKDKYGDPRNGKKKQQQRLEELRFMRGNERRDGRRKVEIPLFDVMQARAKMKTKKAADSEHIVPEIIKALPFEACRKVRQQFNSMYHDEQKKPGNLGPDGIRSDTQR